MEWPLAYLLGANSLSCGFVLENQPIHRLLKYTVNADRALYPLQQEDATWFGNLD